MHPQILHCAAACGVASAVGVFAATRRERGELRWPVVALMVAIAVWTGGMAIRRVLGDGPGSPTAYYIYYAGAVAIAPLWALLATRLTGASWLPPRRALWIAVPSLFAFLAALTNPLHWLYFPAGLPRLDVELVDIAGPLLWGFTVWSYALVAAGVWLFGRTAWRLARSGRVLRGAAIAAAAAMPLPVGLARTFGIAPADYTLLPLAIAVSVSALFVLHWRHRMRETLPLARRDVIEHLADGVIILDDSGRVLDANPAAEDIVGVGVDRLRGVPVKDALGDSNAEVAATAIDQAAAALARGNGPWIHTFRTRDGRSIESSTSDVRGGNGEPAGFFIVLRDHTERRRMEIFLRRSQRLETVAGLSAGIAHEINNPLAFIRSNLNHIRDLSSAIERQLGEKSDRKSEECQELRLVVEECGEGVERITGIVDRMRRFARLRAEELAPLDIGAVVDDALKMARLHEGADVELRYQLSAQLPRVRASHEHLVQLLLNLLVNARQALEDVRLPLIEVTTEAVDGAVFVRVRDNGPGIPPRIRGRIFDPFFTTKAPGEGTGLGLSIAFGIARDHGGVLEFESLPDGGTEFTLQLPAL